MSTSGISGGGQVPVSFEKQNVNKTEETQKTQNTNEVNKQKEQETKAPEQKDSINVKLCDNSKHDPKAVDFDKCGKPQIDPGIIKLKSNLADAKALVADVMASNEPQSLGSHLKFDKMISSMSDKDLLALADHITGLMQNTDGKDGVLGDMLKRVHAEIKGNKPNFDDLFPPKPPKPPFDFQVKYSCVYATRTKQV